jgi:hypothetical protein
MKQKAPANKNQKYLAILLAVIMFSSVFMMFFWGGSDGGTKVNSSNGNEASTSSAETNVSTIPFSQIPGKQVHHQFNSIADGLNMSPDGVMSAAYVDLQKTTGTPLEQSFGNKTMMKSFYGADVTKRYNAYYSDGSGFELHSIPEQKILKSFVPIPYHGYQLLARDTSTNSDIWNVIGSPVILGSRQSVKNVIDVLEGNATSTTEYNQILNQTDPKNVILQVIVARTNNTTDVPADQYYNDLRKLDDGSFEQTSLFLNVRPDFAKNIAALQANSSERGVTYNLTTSGNITKLVLISDFNNLSNETRLVTEKANLNS